MRIAVSCSGCRGRDGLNMYCVANDGSGNRVRAVERRATAMPDHAKNREYTDDIAAKSPGCCRMSADELATTVSTRVFKTWQATTFIDTSTLMDINNLRPSTAVQKHRKAGNLAFAGLRCSSCRRPGDRSCRDGVCLPRGTLDYAEHSLPSLPA